MIERNEIDVKKKNSWIWTEKRRKKAKENFQHVANQ